ncbi:MAG TPA: WYL domain-containing protein [Actinomycetaceae bacterium]|nr:WYL domain-containing protein [Actinomycetaceae bacterium]
MPAEPTGDRVTRMLAMMSYLAGRDEVPITELADHFGVSAAQVMTDLNLLWVTGLPGYYPDDLIDFSFDDAETTVSLREGQGLSRRLPFAPREALALAAAVEWLRALGTAEGVTAEALDSVSQKLRGFTPADVVVTAPVDLGLRETVLQVAEEQGALRIRYVSAVDHVTERVVVPDTLTTDGRHWYLEAWCTRARDRRTFRMDRILAAERSELPEGVFEERAAALVDERAGAEEHSAPETVILLLRTEARWLAEEIPGAKLREVAKPEPLLEVRIELEGWEWLVRRLLGLGDAVVAVSPRELRDELRLRAVAALEAYGEP